MASIIKQVRIERPADEVWDAVADFGNVHTRLVPNFLTDSWLESDDMRVVSFDGGAVAREQLVGVDPEVRRLAYTVVDGPLGFTNHCASVQVLDDGPTGSRFVWITDVLPDTVAGTVDELMGAGIVDIKSALEQHGEDLDPGHRDQSRDM
jgi:hypothetical protein